MPRVEDILNEANDYMLTSKNICNIEVINNNNVKPTNKKEDKNVTITKTASNDVFFPKQKDKLFWCFYIILFNLSEYDMVSNYFTKETEIKYKWIEEFRNNKSLFKPIKVSKNTVETELAHNKMITMTSIKALCYLKNINIFYSSRQISKKIYITLVERDRPKVDFGMTHLIF